MLLPPCVGSAATASPCFNASRCRCCTLALACAGAAAAAAVAETLTLHAATARVACLQSKGVDELASVQDLFTAGAKNHLGRSETETIKWQYIGSEEGWFSTYPGNQDTACNTYDPRFRPWYAAAASVPKAVIVIVDTSGSMASEGRMAAAKIATNTVIDTLDAADSVAVIDFDSAARTASEGMRAHPRLCRADAFCAVLPPFGRARVSTSATRPATQRVLVRNHAPEPCLQGASGTR